MRAALPRFSQDPSQQSYLPTSRVCHPPLSLLDGKYSRINWESSHHRRYRSPPPPGTGPCIVRASRTDRAPTLRGIPGTEGWRDATEHTGAYSNHSSPQPYVSLRGHEGTSPCRTVGPNRENVDKNAFFKCLKNCF